MVLVKVIVARCQKAARDLLMALGIGQRYYAGSLIMTRVMTDTTSTISDSRAI
jgi:hypothetical protein